MKYHGLHLNDNNNKIIKVRMANSDTKKGKSNGYRMLYYAIKENSIVYLLSIYYKKEDGKIPTNEEIIQLVKKYCL